MKILVINGPNLNMLGIREKNLYGDKTYPTLIKMIKAAARERGVKVTCYQSNFEGAIVTKIQRAYKKYDGIVINPGAYTHTSVAILDALKSVNIPTVEVHITEVNEREEYRKISFVKEYAFLTITGKGFDGYIEGLDAIINKK
jgi:3-dehydroquinate dehydratase-2